MSMDKRIGMIYPLLPDHIKRILDGKDVFCKFAGLGKPKIAKGDKLLFYSSRGQYEIRGGATIRDSNYLAPDEVVRIYKKRLFITPEELNRYIERRSRPPGKKLMVMLLQKIQEYPKPYKLEKPVPMSGMVLTENMYKRIISYVSSTQTSV